MSKIAVIGAGSWGTAVASLLAEKHEVKLYGQNQEVNDQINTTHQNKKYLGDVELNKGIWASNKLQEVVTNAEIIVYGVPTKAVRTISEQLVDLIDPANPPYIVSLTKGLEQGTDMRVSEIIESVLPKDLYRDVIVLSGPSHAEEVARKMNTSVTVACTNIFAAQKIQKDFATDYFRLYTNPDVIGVEVAGALKNVIALAAGVLRGLGGGDNATASLITRGLTEISRFGIALGANPFTFMGLSGMGDLIVTATSEHSRNFTAGKKIGEGQTVESVIENMGMVVEGAYTVKAVNDMSGKLKIEMPITKSLYRTLFEGSDARKEAHKLMNRQLKSEVNEE